VDLYDAYRAVTRRLLRRYLKRRFASFGRGSSYDPCTSIVSGYANFHIGNDVFIGSQAFLSADGVRVDIGDDTVIGPGL
jgi:acetyltransferase-like isoleucine patch superfamily enzyme